MEIWPLEHSHCGIPAAKEMLGYTEIDRYTGDNCSSVEVFEEDTGAEQTAGEWFQAFSRRLTLELGKRSFGFEFKWEPWYSLKEDVELSCCVLSLKTINQTT